MQAHAEDADAAVEEPAEAVSEATIGAEGSDGIDVVTAPVVRQDETALLPTRVPGATSAPATSGLADGATTARPAMRAHNTSFFGARRARDVAVTAPLPEQPAVAEVAKTESVVDEVTEPVDVVEETAEINAVDEAAAVVVVQEPVAETAPEGAAEPVDQPASVVDLPEDVVENAPDPVVEQVSETRTAELNDTPIFRAMMSRWLTDDSSVPDSASWSTNEADQAWSAAARIEETQPLDESAAGLPMRRPGSNLIPGAVDESDQKPAASVAPRRDPEAIRRNLNRHKNGVSSARTEAQDGTHREEADVHH